MDARAAKLELARKKVSDELLKLIPNICMRMSYSYVHL